MGINEDDQSTPAPDTGGELLPCPFCGGTDLRFGGDDKWVGAACRSCGAIGPDQYGSGNDWNTRVVSAPSPRIAEGGVDRRIGIVMAALDDFHVLAGRVTQTQVAHVLAKLDAALSAPSVSPSEDLGPLQAQAPSVPTEGHEAAVVADLTPGQLLHELRRRFFNGGGWVDYPEWDDYDEAGHAAWEESAATIGADIKRAASQPAVPGEQGRV